MKDVPIAEFTAKKLDEGSGTVPTLAGRRRISAAEPQTHGHCVGYTEDSSSGKIHMTGSILTQLNHGETVSGGLTSDNLRYQRLSGRTGEKVLFIVDTSGSMLARRKLEMVKGCVLELLKDAYSNRDQIALIGYGGRHAQLFLSYTASPELAAEQLRYMKSGGGTPLLEALDMAGTFLEQYGASSVVLFSDGRYSRKNVSDPEALICSFGERCTALGASLRLIDAESRSFSSADQAKHLAELLHARYIKLDDMREETLLRTLKE